MDIFDHIRKDHEKQRALLKELLATEGDSKKRDFVFKALKEELVKHAEAEERYFYKPLFNHDESQDEARHGVAEHQQIDNIIEEMEKTDMSSPAWMHNAKKLNEMVLHHLADEEKEFFNIADDSLTKDKQKELAENYAEMMG